MFIWNVVTLDHEHLRPKFGQVVHVAMEKKNQEFFFFHNKNWTGWGANS
jgi:hypothetical protein